MALVVKKHAVRCSFEPSYQGNILPKAQLLSLNSDPFSLPDFVIQVDNKVVDELLFRLGSEGIPRNLQNHPELIPGEPADPPKNSIAHNAGSIA